MHLYHQGRVQSGYSQNKGFCITHLWGASGLEILLPTPTPCREYQNGKNRDITYCQLSYYSSGLMKTTQNSIYKQTRSRFNSCIYEAPISMKIRLQAMVLQSWWFVVHTWEEDMHLNSPFRSSRWDVGVKAPPDHPQITSKHSDPVEVIGFGRCLNSPRYRLVDL